MKFIPEKIKAVTNKVSLSSVIVVTAGIILGSTVGTLLSIPINRIEWRHAGTLSLILTIVTTVGFTALFYFQKDTLIASFNNYWPFDPSKSPRKKKKKIKRKMVPLQALLLDSSAIIDGRIVDIIRTGFIEGELMVTTDILSEIKRIADSKDPLKKQRGRRALDILEEMKKEKYLPFRIYKVVNQDNEGLDVDDRLLVAAAEVKGKVLTTDYNLHKKAKIMGITVLNINELANMVKTIVLPGEKLTIDVIQEGKGDGQGIGYLPDGTMVVVEGGAKLIHKTVDVEVLRLLQTDAGKMIFSKP
jgi:uncharacterized protein YacL